MNSFDNLGIDAWRNGHILELPGCVLDDWDLDWREVDLLEVTLLGFIPHEGFILFHHEVMKQFMLFGE